MKKSNLLRIACGFLAATLLASCFATAAAGAVSFKDVQKGAWYYNAVAFAVQKGLMNGVGDGNFAPDGSADRAMLVTLLYRMEGEPAVLQSTPFTDLQADWYKKSVAWAYANGIVNGLSATTYGPTQKLTREQFATILYRYNKDYLKLNVGSAPALSGYPDLKKVSSWAQAAMAWANAEGLITGTAKGGKVYLDPQGNATRAQMATIFQRLDAYQERMEAAPPPAEEQPTEPVKPPCRFGTVAHQTSGTMGEQSTHFYLCQEDGCYEMKVEPCSVQIEKSFASCDTPATINYSCEVCGYNQTMADPSGKPYGHKLSTPVHQGTWVEEAWGDEPEKVWQYHTSYCQNEGCSYVKRENCVLTTQAVSATCTQEGGTLIACTSCNYSVLEKTQERTGHTWSAYTTASGWSHQRHCVNAGCSETEQENCTKVVQNLGATCKDYAKKVTACETCGKKTETIDYASTLVSHSYGDAPQSMGNGLHRYYCAYGCGKYQTEACTITVTDIYRPGKKGVKRSTCSECDYLHEVADDTLATMPNQEGAYKVITYNLKSLYYDPATRTTGNIDQLNNVADLLKRFDADVIGLQEVDMNNPRSWNRNQVKALADALGYEYYYFCQTVTKGGYDYGTAFISRYPIKGEPERVKFATQNGEERYYTRVVLEFPESDVVFYNTHLCTGSNTETDGSAARQFNELIQRICKETLPTLLTGDFNLRHYVREQLYDKSKVMSLNAEEYDDNLRIDDIYIRNANYYVDPQSGRSLFRVEEFYSDHEMAYGMFTLK